MPYRAILDVGAHKGGFSAAAQAYFQAEKTWLIEADPDLAKELQARFPAPLFKVIAGAVTNRSGTVSLKINSHRDSSSLLRINPESQQIFNLEMKEVGEVEVPAFTLDELFQRENIQSVDLMKVDIQGAEKLMLMGANEALKKIKTIYIEVLFEPLYEGCAEFGELDQLLQKGGFKLRSFHETRPGSDGALAYANALYLQTRL